MRDLTTRLVPVLASALLVAAPAAAQVGRPLPAGELEDFRLTGADSLDDLLGRTVLIEFFAHW